MKTNVQQRFYINAKRHLETLEAQEREAERQFIIRKGFVNSDGSIPRHTWAIDDDATADAAIEEYGAYIEATDLWKDLCHARENFRNAEQSLINYAISISPEEIRGNLRKASEHFKYRKQMIDTVLCLDVSTVKR